MKRSIVLTAITAFLFTGLVAQVGSRGNFNTGVPDLDADLNQINELAYENIDQFVTDLSTSYKVPVTEVQNIMNRGLQPAETYLAYEVAGITRKPVKDVVDTYEKNKGKGWGVVAKELGIKPGSSEFHALKANTKTKKDEIKAKKDKKDKDTDKGKPEDKKDKNGSSGNGNNDKDKNENKGKGNSNSNSNNQDNKGNSGGNGNGKGNSNSKGKGKNK